MNTRVGAAGAKGRGVFATGRILEGEIFERAPVIEFPKEEWKQIELTVLGTYCYFWGEDFEDGAVVLGLGSLYNHSFSPNAKYVHRFSEKIMEYVAIKDIEAGEEITINYNGSSGNNAPVWFDVIE